MKQQRSILIVEKNGKVVDFERFPYKRYQTILKKYKQFFEKHPNSHNGAVGYFNYHDADIIKIMESPDGYNYNEDKPIAEFTPEQFYKIVLN